MEAPQAGVKARRPKWLWATSYLKVALNPIGATSALALIAVWWMEFYWRSAHTWFGKYPVTIGLITGLLNLIFTLSLVNRLIERRDELRWRDIRNTTLKGLNDEVRATRDILWVALWGQPPFGPSPHTDAACEVVAQYNHANWPKAPAETADSRAQIEATESDADRAQAAAQILRLATERIRQGLVRWAPMMTLAHGDYKALVPVTTLADVLEVMEFPFADKRIAKAGGRVDDKFHKGLLDLWLHAITTCVYAEENIVKALYPWREYPERPKTPPWTSEEPRRLMLSPAQLIELDLWLGHPLTFWLRHPLTFRLRYVRKFRRDTRDRSYAVQKDVDWPW